MTDEKKVMADNESTTVEEDQGALRTFTTKMETADVALLCSELVLEEEKEGQERRT